MFVCQDSPEPCKACCCSRRGRSYSAGSNSISPRLRMFARKRVPAPTGPLENHVDPPRPIVPLNLVALLGEKVEHLFLRAANGLLTRQLHVPGAHAKKVRIRRKPSSSWRSRVST